MKIYKLFNHFTKKCNSFRSEIFFFSSAFLLVGNFYYRTVHLLPYTLIRSEIFCCIFFGGKQSIRSLGVTWGHLRVTCKCELPASNCIACILRSSTKRICKHIALPDDLPSYCIHAHSKADHSCPLPARCDCIRVRRCP